MVGSRRLRRLLGGVAAFGTAVALLGGSGGTAQAEESDYRIRLDAELGLPLSGSKLQQPWFSAQLERPAGDTASRDYVFTYDFSEIADFVDVKVRSVDDDHCAIEGTKMICRETVQGEDIFIGVPELLAAKGSKNGQSGTLRVVGESEGITIQGASTLVRVGGPDLAAVRVDLKDRPAVGEVQRPRFAFVNKGTLPAQGVLLALTTTRGMELARTAGNCEYADLRGPARTGFALCAFGGTFDPGSTYRINRGMELKTLERAYVDQLSYGFYEDTPAERERLRDGLTFTRGTGPAVALEKVGAGTRSTDLYIWDNDGWYEPRAVNTADFQAVGDVAEGEKGETVNVDLGFRNNGPAWVTGGSGGDPRTVGGVQFTVPAGTRVTSFPKGCGGYSADGRNWIGDKPGAPVYRCMFGEFVLEDERHELPFGLTIEKDVENSEGEIKVVSFYHGGHSRHDETPDNDKAAVVVNPKDVPPGDTTGGSTGGSSGGSATGGSTGGSSAGSVTGGPTGGSVTGSANGGLAATGSSALVAGLGAAAAVVAGGVLFVVARRRRAVRRPL
jgi:hypothetical protein